MKFLYKTILLLKYNIVIPIVKLLAIYNFRPNLVCLLSFRYNSNFLVILVLKIAKRLEHASLTLSSRKLDIE